MRPSCEEWNSCDQCLVHGPDCAWCGRENTCVPSSDAQAGLAQCTAVQYQAPCRSTNDRKL